MAKKQDFSDFFGKLESVEDSLFWANHTPYLIRVSGTLGTIFTEIVDHEDFKEGSYYSYYPMQGFLEKVLNAIKVSGVITPQELDAIMGRNGYSSTENFLKTFMVRAGKSLKEKEIQEAVSALEQAALEFSDRLMKVSSVVVD